MLSPYDFLALDYKKCNKIFKKIRNVKVISNYQLLYLSVPLYI